jgi:trehalose 2-sulfotransferase
MKLLQRAMRFLDGAPPLCLSGYAICTAPRSGSNYLSQVLASTGKLGNPLEYFNAPARRVLDDPSYPDDPIEQTRRIKTVGATSNGVYGLKLFASQHDQIADRISWTRELPALQFVSLRRDDLIAQAISWSRALQTGQYRATQPVQKPAEYNAHHISERLRDIVIERARWDQYFALNAITPLRLTYETVIADPQGAADAVAGHIGLEAHCPVDLAKVNVERQADDLSLEWRERFLRHSKTPDRIPPFF